MVRQTRGMTVEKETHHLLARVDIEPPSTIHNDNCLLGFLLFCITSLSEEISKQFFLHVRESSRKEDEFGYPKTPRSIVHLLEVEGVAAWDHRVDDLCIRINFSSIFAFRIMQKPNKVRKKKCVPTALVSWEFQIQFKSSIENKEF